MHRNNSVLYDTGTLVWLFSAVRREGCGAIRPLQPAKSARFRLLNQIEFAVEGKHIACANLFPTASRQIRVLYLIMQISFKLQTSKPNPPNLRIARRVIWLAQDGMNQARTFAFTM